jgi:hypothetical protein
MTSASGGWPRRPLIRHIEYYMFRRRGPGRGPPRPIEFCRVLPCMHQARPAPPPAPPPAVSLPRDQPTEPLVQRRDLPRPAGGAQRDQRPPWSSQGGDPWCHQQGKPCRGLGRAGTLKIILRRVQRMQVLGRVQGLPRRCRVGDSANFEKIDPDLRAQRQKRQLGTRGRRFFGRCAEAVADLPRLCTPTRPPVVLHADLRQLRDGVSWRTVVVPNLDGTDRSTPRQGRRSDQAHAKGLLDRSSVGLLCTM